jgi:hypothetical protein
MWKRGVAGIHHIMFRARVRGHDWSHSHGGRAKAERITVPSQKSVFRAPDDSRSTIDAANSCYGGSRLLDNGGMVVTEMAAMRT